MFRANIRKSAPRAVTEPQSLSRCFDGKTLGLCLLLSAAGVLSAQDALAHAIVVRTSPAQGGTAAGAIGKVEVWYDAGIRDAFVALAVVSAAGERVDKRDAAIDSSDPSHVSVGVNQLTPGKYTARYRALSADGHIVSGSWDFEITP